MADAASSRIIHAKSAYGHFQVSLVEHTRDVLNAADAMFGVSGTLRRLGREWCRFFRLDDPDSFVRHLRIAVCLHDIGKANSGFQKAVSGHLGAQCVWHEHLSAILIQQAEPLKEFQSEQIDFDIVTVAVAGHHFRAHKRDLGNCTNAEVKEFTLLSDGVGQILEFTRKATGLSLESQVVKERDELWSYGNRSVDATSAAKQLQEHLRKWRRQLKKQSDDSLRNLTIAVRAALIVADAAGSGFVRTADATTRSTIVADQLQACFGMEPFDGPAIREQVIRPRLKQINEKVAADGRQPFEWHGFQEAAAELGPRALLLAGCGAGKTLAAWRWIEAQANKKPIARVIFLYPTRATATEGFRDYVSWAPEGALATGTAAYELDGMFSNPADSRSKRDYSTDDRLFAIGYWHRRIFSATVDQFLGFMQHSYRSICLLPMLVDSVVVFDEIHSFDKSLFSAFKRFLQEFDIPVLSMTASLPQERTRALVEECGLTVFPEKPDRFTDLHERAEMPRYKIRVVERSDVHSVVEEAQRDGRKILWVVNTVRRCQEVAREFNAVCYHSGFTLDDRKSRHADVIEKFQTKGESILAVTTQVCEMSLDLDAWLLVTEKAPIPAMIQRLGRCNRHAVPGDDSLGQVLVYEPEKQLPYDDDDMVGVDDFLDEVDGRVVGQLELQQLLEKHGLAAPEPDKYAAFVQSGPWAVAHEKPLRDESDFTAQAVLDRDVDEYLAKKKKRYPTDGFVVPAPRWMTEPDDRLPRWLRSVPCELYTTELGLDRGDAAREFFNKQKQDGAAT